MPPNPPSGVAPSARQGGTIISSWLRHCYEHEGIRLDPNKIEYNPGLRALAKFALNSLWGTYIILVHAVNPR